MEAADKTPTVQMSTLTQLPVNTNCLACSEDGRFLCLGHGRGLSVWRASSLDSVADWLQDRLEITCVQMSRAAESTYLLATVDDMGVARLFVQHFDMIYLLSVINIMEDINRRSVCLAFELSEGGRYGAASLSCGGAARLEVYHLPLPSWLKELEMLPSQQQDSKSSADLRWSPVTMVIQIKPPNHPAGQLVDGELDVSQTSGFLTHCLTLDVTRSSGRRGEKQFFNRDAEKTKEPNKSPGRCTQHFLLPCGQFSGEDKADVQPGSPVAVAVWWSGSHNLLQYSLQKTPKTKADVERQPDVLWPNAKEIFCSAVSRNTRYVALGLSDASVCVCDRLSGAPLSVVMEPASSSAFFRMQFVDYWPLLADESQTFNAEKVNLVVLCRSGAVHTVTTGRGTQSWTTQRSERSKDSRDFPVTMIPVPFLQGLSLVVQMNGKMFLQDVVGNRTVCLLTPSTPHLITTPCNPVYALNTEQQSLFIRGDQENSCDASSMKGSQLLSFHFKDCDVVKQYESRRLHPPRRQAAPRPATLEETCSLYLQQRVLSADERNKSLRKTWEQLQKTAVTVQQRCQSVGQPANCSG